jgi:hypothetical protein
MHSFTKDYIIMPILLPPTVFTLFFEYSEYAIRAEMKKKLKNN